jgi:hypothetical protein
MVATQFQSFGHLPVEVRRLIWALALPSERRIQAIAFDHYQQILTVSYPPPSVLFVCRESRDETMRFFRRLQLPSYIPFDHDAPSITYCFFNPSLDTIYLVGNLFFRSILVAWLNSDDDFSQIPSIALDRRWVNSTLDEGDRIITAEAVVRRLGHVKLLHIVSHDGCWDERFGPTRHRWERDGMNVKCLYSLVDYEEIASRRKLGRPKIWAEFGPWSRTAYDWDLSTESPSAGMKYDEMKRALEIERSRYPDDWAVPRIQLDFVILDRIIRLGHSRGEGRTTTRSSASPTEPGRVENSASFWSRLKRFVALQI